MCPSGRRRNTRHRPVDTSDAPGPGRYPTAVGTTSIARAIADGLAMHGCRTHLSTTDPAGNFDDLAADSGETLTVSRIDPATEVRHYVEQCLAAAVDRSPEERALLEEDLRSPCTEEIAVFSAFTRLLRRGRDHHVVIDTAPSGHTMVR